MTNEVGNMLFEAVAKDLLSQFDKDKNLRQNKDVILDRLPNTRIFNISDVSIKSLEVYDNLLDKDIKNNEKDDEGSVNRITNATGITFRTTTQTDPNFVVNRTVLSKFMPDKEFNLMADIGYTPYLDNLFLYSTIPSEDNRQLYQALIMFRLDDEKVFTYYSQLRMVRGIPQIMMSGGVPIKITLGGLILSMTNMFTYCNDIILHTTPNLSKDEFSKKAEIILNFILLYYFTSLAMFRDIANQNRKTYACYIDEPESPRNMYFRKDNKNAIKLQEKPIILVLRDTHDKVIKVEKHKRKHGHIEYSFSWVVRGHYRKLHNPETVGKDRNGEKTVQGMTWVETYLKGNKDMPLVNRHTEVHDRRKHA